MPTPGQLAYIKSTSRYYKPLKHVTPGRAAWDKVSFLWGDPVYVISSHGDKAKDSKCSEMVDKRTINGH